MSTEREARTVGLDATVGPLYACRDADVLGVHYTRHLNAMTAENLRAKFEIAAELAHRDLEIEQLTRLACALYDQIDNWDAQEHYRKQIAALRPNTGGKPT